MPDRATLEAALDGPFDPAASAALDYVISVQETLAALARLAEAEALEEEVGL